MKEIINTNDPMAILDSDEFNSLLEAAELVTRAQNNITQLNKSMQELKDLVNADTIDGLTNRENILMFDIIESMEELVDNFPIHILTSDITD